VAVELCFIANFALMKITKERLDRSYAETFNIDSFLQVDPCGIVYELKEHTDNLLDIELGALFVAMISWGNRKAIRSAARRMLGVEMKWRPGAFVMSGAYRDSYMDARNNCVYRTLNRDAFILVCENIQRALASSGCSTLEGYFASRNIDGIIRELSVWLKPARLGTFGTSACKRICMYLRWMIRTQAPDLGLWRNHSQRDLYAVMDVHVCRLTAELTGMNQASWKNCCRLTQIFRSWDAADPLKYDVALMTVVDNG